MATANRFGTFPTFTRVTSRRLFTSITETSSVSVLLMQAYLPSGVNTIQFGLGPVAYSSCDLLRLDVVDVHGIV